MSETDSRLDFSAGGLVRAAREAMVGCDEAQRVVLFNPAAERMFGHAARDVIGRPLALLLPQRFRDRHDAHAREFDNAEGGGACVTSVVPLLPDNPVI